MLRRGFADLSAGDQHGQRRYAHLGRARDRSIGENAPNHTCGVI
jgi:hypothetical protein